MEIFRILLTEYGEQAGLDTQWQAMDGSLLRAPTRSQKTAAEGPGRNPADRGRSGSKLHLHMDGQGIPLGAVVVGANVHDSRLTGATLENSCQTGAWFPGTKEAQLAKIKKYGTRSENL